MKIYQTNLSVSEGKPFYATAHRVPGHARQCNHDVERVIIQLRQIGWIDQKGRVYKETPKNMVAFDGGSLTPLLIHDSCD